MDQFHRTVDVYTDANAAGNHFSARGSMNNTSGNLVNSTMDETCMDNPHSGINCIRCNFLGKMSWSGWYFMNGILESSNIEPKENWGDYPNAGIDLSGATKLTFWARGEKGGERVEFFCLGIGRDAFSGESIKPYPDSSPKVSNDTILTTAWKEYSIDLSKSDLSYVLGGFGWVVSTSKNNYQEVTFYIDDIQYNKARLNEPRFINSYKTITSTFSFDAVMRNVAYSYDNATALLAFLASGENERAQLLAEAFMYAQQHDRYYSDGRIRNAYQGGDLVSPPGWIINNQESTVRIPGWYQVDSNRWLEDKFQVGTYTGNVAWVMIALLSYYEACGGIQYLETAKQLGEWVDRNCKDMQTISGYTAGFEGQEPNVPRLAYKSTEYNLELYTAFKKIFDIELDTIWYKRAVYAQQFVLSMWDSLECKFWAGTNDDGNTINKDVVPLDIQGCAVLALNQEDTIYWKALEYAETYQNVERGFDFNEDRDGIWYQGTSLLAIAYSYIKQNVKGYSLLEFLHSDQDTSGGMFESNKDGLTTGFDWFYFHRLHLGTTAWLILAENNVNPFYTHTPVRVEEDIKYLLEDYKLYQNYPNPFNHTTRIRFKIPIDTHVKIIVFDYLGQEIDVLLNSFQNRGEYDVYWNSKNLTSGIYFYQLKTNDYVETRKIILLR